MENPVIIDYYSDILCVWAWIAQRRNEELLKTFGAKIEFQQHYVDIFGDVPTKIKNQWGQKGGYDGFAKHVNHSVSTFDDIFVNPKIWSEVQPTTSANAHLILKAVERVYNQQTSSMMAVKLRNAFFVDAIDISNLEMLNKLVTEADLDSVLIKQCINDGLAIASLMNDYQQSKLNNIKGSPSYIIDKGRQTLYGNVGYRILYANIEEHISQPEVGASWC